MLLRKASSKINRFIERSISIIEKTTDNGLYLRVASDILLMLIFLLLYPFVRRINVIYKNTKKKEEKNK